MTAPLLIALIGVFVTVAIVVGGTTSWLLARNTLQQRRLRAVVRGGADSTGILVQATPVLTTGPIQHFSVCPSSCRRALRRCRACRNA
jgi:hypothetical protein